MCCMNEKQINITYHLRWINYIDAWMVNQLLWNNNNYVDIWQTDQLILLIIWDELIILIHEW